MQQYELVFKNMYTIVQLAIWAV